MNGVDTEELVATLKITLLMVKGQIFDSGITVHVYSYKEMFNSLVAKEKRNVKMVDDLTCEVINTRTINVTCRDGTVRALEAVWYVPKAQ